jgi:hypothetical protein
MELIGANADARPLGVGPLSTTINYFQGNRPESWRTSVATFTAVSYADVYPGIDMVYYGKGGHLEYDFVVAAGANPAPISLEYSGADAVDVDANGDLVIQTAAGALIQERPYLYQDIDGARREVDGRFQVERDFTSGETTRVGFAIGAYDPNHALTIDPLVMSHSSFLGGKSNDTGHGVGVDGEGNIYLTGLAGTIDFPATPGAYDPSHNGGASDVFVSKISPDGKQLLYSTFLGGSGDETGYRLAVDHQGSVVVAGFTESPDFPATAGAFDTTHNGGADAFIAKLDASGSELEFATFLGGAQDDIARSVAVDAEGSIYVTGWTFSSGFPTTQGAFDTSHNGTNDVFVTKLRGDGSKLGYSTFIGGPNLEWSAGIDVDELGQAHIVGYTQSTSYPVTSGAFDVNYNGGTKDAFATKLNASGSSLVYSTFIGGAATDFGRGIALDSAGNAYVTGFTESADFPTTPGAFDESFNGGPWDAFVLKLNSEGNRLAYSTFLGGEGEDSRTGSGIAINRAGVAYVTGVTESCRFPATPDAFDTTYNGGKGDAFLVALSEDGSELIYATYLGGFEFDRGHGIAVDSAGNTYLVGETFSNDFPTTPGALKARNRGSIDVFVTKFAEVAGSQPLISRPGGGGDSRFCYP